jgi:cytochrome bd-type quinol oxidase subunit 2
MPAPRRARARLVCGLAATAVAAALALAPLARVEGQVRDALAWVAGAGLLLAAGAALRTPALLAPALVALLAEYTLVLLAGGDRVDAAAPLVGAGLLLYAELATWAREARPRVRDERAVLAVRAAVVAASTLGAVVVGALVLLAAALPAGEGLARLAVGVVATTATLALVAVVARPTATRVPRG